MPDYTIVHTIFGDSIIRNSDGACIPICPGNRDYDEYLEWVAAGGVPDEIDNT
ncbi:hypothetical protein ABZR86_02680 [Dyella marensis]|uniref:Uncharacterized protein n=1 Tax=Dyella marensis TaxID=500610 RepID=A0A1I1ZWN8_9GAMM|nr:MULTISPECIES: hypothetical protein [Dyella]SFE36075.1 hypothetical protein SAMN02799615_00839 [Dyella marensis]